MNKPCSIFLFFSIFYFTLSASAQKAHKVEGTSQVRVENNMSKEQAQEKAEELAKIKAIENEFGTYVEQDADIRVDDGAISYNIIGSTRVKGEWVETTKLQFKEDFQEQQVNKSKENVMWISCTIEGTAMEIRSKANIKVSTLRCPMPECQTEAFFDKDSLFLYFKSPIGGYLSVFYDEGETTGRLFPYKDQGTESAVWIEGDRDYILFSDEKNMNKFKTKVDKLELYTDRGTEYNNVYVVFSPLPYCKPILSDAILLGDGYTLPKAIPSANFQRA